MAVATRFALTLGLVVGAGLGCATTTEVVPEQFHLPPGGNAEAGKQAFTDLGCVSCHRVTGHEDLPAPSAEAQVPFVLGAPRPSRATDARLVTAIINPDHKIRAAWQDGVVSDTGDSRMTEYRDVMTIRQLMDLVAFLRKAARRAGAEGAGATGATGASIDQRAASHLTQKFFAEFLPSRVTQAERSDAIKWPR